MVRERARELCSGADAASGERVEQKTRALGDRWNVACEGMLLLYIKKRSFEYFYFAKTIFGQKYYKV